MKKRILGLIMILVFAFSMLAGCSNGNDSTSNTGTTEKENAEKGEIILATTTSTQDSGLLDYLLPKFTEETGIKVKTVAVGTGKALEMGKNGEADVLLVHAKSDEEQFVADGYGTERSDVMYNDFILVGPKSDPLQIKAKYPNDISGALQEISSTETPFISRGDDSGTNKAELKLWKSTGIESPSGDWYISAGSGMGDVLKMAGEKQAYTIADRGTYLSMKDSLDLQIVTEKEDKLYNQYGVIPVDPEKSGAKNINHEGAKAFADWITSESAQKLINEFGVDKYGEQLFIANASK